MTAPIIIAAYDPQWPKRFETLRQKISRVLGPMAAAIEHIGSTAVPGLASKPIIDLDILLGSAADLPRAIAGLGLLGYEHLGDLGIPGREAFRSPTGEPAHHLYVCPPDSMQYKRHIAFRDHLRTHPEDADAYVRLKRDLSAKYRVDRDAYTQSKTQFIEAVLRHAAPKLSL